ncbi:MAG: sigma-54-dependent Fis family transcriptional regulator, partial [Deltaproteobacteria bacterium]
HLPPLAERREDIPLLAHHFLGRYAETQAKSIKNFSDEAMEVLVHYEYPGNIRELQNIVERAVVLCNGEEILAKHLPQELGQYSFKVYRQSSRQFPTLEENEVEYVSWILKQVDGNKTKAAGILGIDRVSLWRKLKRWGLDENAEEASP